MTRKRCFGNGQAFYADYHDNEWGLPVYDDCILFEFLVLEGAQAGLSWETILKKREGYRNAFLNFDVQAVAQLTDEALEEFLHNREIVRNRLKILSARKNAIAFIAIQQEFGSFGDYLWAWVNHKPIINDWSDACEVPARSELSDRISKDLKKRSMTFVGSTIVYAFLQAVGVVNDHPKTCWCYARDRGL